MEAMHARIHAPAAALLVSSALGLAASPSAAHAAQTVHVAPVEAPTDEARWYELRVAERVGEHFELLGWVPLERPAARALEVTVRAKPADVDRSRDEVTLELSARRGKARVTRRVKGRAQEIDALTGELVLGALEALDLELPPGAKASVPAWRYPFSVHRFLARASVRMWRGEHRQAALMYGRAQEMLDRVWVPEAFEGRHRAEAYLVTLADGDPNAKRDLARAAAERAEIAFRDHHPARALRALESFLRYAPSRALRWQRRLDLGDAVLRTRRAPWSLAPDPKTLWRLDPRTGVLAARGPGRPGLVDVLQKDLVTLEGRTLARFEPDGRARWTLRLPAIPGPGGTVTTSGLLGVLGEDTVAWADLSVGELGQVASGVVPLASGVGGVVALVPGEDGASKGPDLALLRPGKKTPAWRRSVAGVRATAMTRDRVVVVADEGLLLLRSHDGKPAREPLPMAQGARILGARGRYAGVAEGDGRVAIVDILAGERTATVEGPGRPVAAQTTRAGLAVLFESQDLVFFDRDGRMIDRAWVPGRPVALYAGSPVTPGPVVHTNLGLFALSEVDGEAALGRDVDGALAAARALLELDNPQAALRLATAVAAAGAGRVGDAEALRARILGARADAPSAAAAARAQARAERAKSAERTLGPFAP